MSANPSTGPGSEDATQSGYTTVEIYGSSDDLIEIRGELPGCDEYYGESGLFEIAGLQVEIDYMPNGCWGIRVTRSDEAEPVTAKDLSLDLGAGMTAEVLAGKAPMRGAYTMVLRMSVPADAAVKTLRVS